MSDQQRDELFKLLYFPVLQIKLLKPTDDLKLRIVDKNSIILKILKVDYHIFEELIQKLTQAMP